MAAPAITLVDAYGRPLRSDPPPARKPEPRRAAGMSAKYDAAETTPENRNHWANADGMGPNAAMSPGVRAKLRNRSRYECENNGYFGSLVEGRANDGIGCGPRLQLNLPESWVDPDFQVSQATPEGAAREVELKYLDWAESIGLADDLLVLDETETRDGEVFAVAVSNPQLPPDAPQLDLMLYEAEQCAAPVNNPADPLLVDGVRVDRLGNPVSYTFMRQHPGEAWLYGQFEYDTIPADRVFHLYTRKRPRQARGVTPLAPALPLGSVMRRYTGASLGAAETQAMIAAVLENENLAPDDGTGAAPEIEAMDQIPFAKSMLLTLHAGQKAKTLTPTAPGTGYREFKGEVLTECGRSIGAPRNVSTGSSAEYNYSSGRLDHLPYQRGIRIRRDRWRRHLLDRLFRMWLREASLIPGYLPDGLPPARLWRWNWRWDGFQSIDPVKDATANEILMRSGQTTLERVCAENGDDWEEVLEQQAREMRKREKLGLPAPEWAAVTITDQGGDTTKLAPQKKGVANAP